MRTLTRAPVPRGLAFSAFNTLRRECTWPAASMKVKSRARCLSAAVLLPRRIAAASFSAAASTTSFSVGVRGFRGSLRSPIRRCGCFTLHLSLDGLLAQGAPPQLFASIRIILASKSRRSASPMACFLGGEAGQREPHGIPWRYEGRARVRRPVIKIILRFPESCMKFRDFETPTKYLAHRARGAGIVADRRRPVFRSGAPGAHRCAPHRLHPRMGYR